MGIEAKQTERIQTPKVDNQVDNHATSLSSISLPSLAEIKKAAETTSSLFSSLKLPSLDSLGLGTMSQVGQTLVDAGKNVFGAVKDTVASVLPSLGATIDESFKSAYSKCREFIDSISKSDATTKNPVTPESLAEFRENLKFMRKEVEVHKDKFSKEFSKLIESCEKLEALIEKDQKVIEKSGAVVAERLGSDVVEKEECLRKHCHEKSDEKRSEIRRQHKKLSEMGNRFEAGEASDEEMKNALREVKETISEVTEREKENFDSYREGVKEIVKEASEDYSAETVDSVMEELEGYWSERDVYYDSVQEAVEAQFHETECAFEAYSDRYSAYLALQWTPGLSGNAFFDSPYSDVAFYGELKELTSSTYSAISRVNEGEKGEQDIIPTLDEHIPEFIKFDPTFEKTFEEVFDTRLTEKERREVDEEAKELERRTGKKIYRDINGNISTLDQLTASVSELLDSSTLKS